jgi:hypothetical protein
MAGKRCKHPEDLQAPVSIRVPLRNLREIDKAADAEYRSRTDLIRELVLIGWQMRKARVNVA